MRHRAHTCRNSAIPATLPTRPALRFTRTPPPHEDGQGPYRLPLAPPVRTVKAQVRGREYRVDEKLSDIVRYAIFVDDMRTHEYDRLDSARDQWQRLNAPTFGPGARGGDVRRGHPAGDMGSARPHGVSQARAANRGEMRCNPPRPHDHPTPSGQRRAGRRPYRRRGVPRYPQPSPNASTAKRDQGKRNTSPAPARAMQTARTCSALPVLVSVDGCL